MNKDIADNDLGMYSAICKAGDKEVQDALRAIRDYYNSGSNFSSNLVYLIQKSDPQNRARLRKGFPILVGLWEVCDYLGGEGMTFESFMEHFEFND